MSKKNNHGKLIVFEGPDGVGKTTISQKISKYLNALDEKCELMTFPGKEPGTLGELIYGIHHEPWKYGVKNITSASKQVLHIAAHLDTIESRILPVLAEGYHVILDRFWWSTWVYGLVSGVNRQVLTKMINLERKCWKGVQPEIAFLLCRNTPINREVTLAEWKKLAFEYEALAIRENSHYPVEILDNNDELNNILQKIKVVLGETLHSAESSRTVQDKFEQEQLNLELNQRQTKQSSKLTIASHILPAKPTVVFDTYWRFAVERQNIFFRKIRNESQPWTEDPILTTFKFTNAYRASDRVSQYLIRNVIYRDDLPSSHEEVFFRILLFKFFNKIQTWQLLEQSIGAITYSEYSFERYDQVLSKAMQSKKAIYSAAYIMPSGGKSFGYSLKHRNH